MDIDFNKYCIGIYDFSYAPYALGDVITWTINLCIRAIETKKREIVQFIIADPKRPSFHLQKYITVNNYFEYLNNILPAFLCCSNSVSTTIIHDKLSFDVTMLKKIFNRKHIWPSFFNHLFGRLDYYSHKLINNFYKKNGYIPRVIPPKGYEKFMEDFITKNFSQKFIVSVNIRQRKFYNDLRYYNVKPILNRDSNLDAWYKFFKFVEQKYPDILFVVLGGYNEWERSLYNFKNIFIPRAIGHNLAHELTILLKSDLFMGSSSGFAAVATFSEVPYIITNYDPAAAKHVNIPIGCIKYPFALDYQILSWEIESTELLIGLFEKFYFSLRKF